MSAVDVRAKSSVFLKLFSLIQRFPGAKEWFFRKMYNLVAVAHSGSDLVFMNYGYSAEELDSRRLDGIPESDRFSAQMYEHLAAQVDLGGRDLLEVGSGRGGGLAYIARSRALRRVVGVDLSPKQVEFCRSVHRDAPCSFQAGSAIDLPFPDAQFDIVMNVESSHCYPDVDKFFSEVCRVLRPGGYFLYADFSPTQTGADATRFVAEVKDRLVAAGFASADIRDITPNVVAALETTDAEKRRLIMASPVTRMFFSSFADFAALKGSAAYELFKNRDSIYYSALVRKAEKA